MKTPNPIRLFDVVDLAQDLAQDDASAIFVVTFLIREGYVTL